MPLVPAGRAGQGPAVQADRQLRGAQAGAHAALLADVAKVAGDSVAHVDHGARQAERPDQRALLHAGRGSVAALPRRGRVRLIRGQPGIQEEGNARRGVSHAPGDHDAISHRRSRAQDHVLPDGLADEKDVDEDPQPRAGDVAAHDIHPERASLFAQARVQLVNEGQVEPGGQAEGHQGIAGDAAGRGDVAQVDGQGLVTEAARRDCVTQEMRSLHLHVAGGEPHALRRRLQHRDVIADPHHDVRPGLGESAADPLDQSELSKLLDLHLVLTFSAAARPAADCSRPRRRAGRGPPPPRHPPRRWRIRRPPPRRRPLSWRRHLYC